LLRRKSDNSFFEDLPDSPGLDVLAAGTARFGTSDLLASGEMRQFLAKARTHYNLIVIDGPPVANLADAEILSEISDLNAFVIKWKSTRIDQVRAALRRISTDNQCHLILNALDIAEVARYGEIYDYESPAPRRSLFSGAAASTA